MDLVELHWELNKFQWKQFPHKEGVLIFLVTPKVFTPCLGMFHVMWVHVVWISLGVLWWTCTLEVAYPLISRPHKDACMTSFLEALEVYGTWWHSSWYTHEEWVVCLEDASHWRSVWVLGFQRTTLIPRGHRVAWMLRWRLVLDLCWHGEWTFRLVYMEDSHGLEDVLELWSTWRSVVSWRESSLSLEPYLCLTITLELDMSLVEGALYLCNVGCL